MNTSAWGLCALFMFAMGCGDDDGQNNNNNQNENQVVCGNGRLEVGEQCDDGAQNSDSEAEACRTDCRFAFCGDGVVDASEFCDGDELNATGCIELGLGYTGGTLSCGADCRFDDSECTECGDGVRDGDEPCDTNDFGSSNCSTETGLQEGIITCNVDCTIDTSACHTCGDGIVQTPSEDCEGNDVGTFTCEALGYVWGILRCTDCGFDRSGCHSDCGNGVAEAGEECDASDFAGRSCTDYGYVSGGLRCSSGCLVSIEACSRCGNGTADTNEECDGADLMGATCASLSGGVMTGSPSCTAGCQLDTTSCVAPASCGNNLKEVGESCDGTDLPVTECVAFRPDLYGGGALTCQPNCLYNQSGCTPIIRCGNGIAESSYGEQCDGQDLAGATCTSRGYTGGTLHCGPQCNYDESQCLPALSCGNGTKEAGEACDGADLGGQTCLSLGYLGGALSCTAQCALDKSQCDSCGDGVVTGTDECDGADLAGANCTSLGYYGGTLLCGSGCSYNLASCAAAGRCGDDTRNGSEVCDGADLSGQTCVSRGYYLGNLGCLSTCSDFDESNCAGRCGDGQINGSEMCDGQDLGQMDCTDHGFTGGVLGCQPGCTDFDTAACSTTGILYVNILSATCPGIGSFSEPFCSLRVAIAAAVPSNIIEILDGVYSSTDTIAVPVDDLTIRGQAFDPLLIMMTSDGTSVIDIQANNVKLQDLFVFVQGDVGVTGRLASGLVLDTVTISDGGPSSAAQARTGMFLSNMGSVTLVDTIIAQLNSHNVKGIYIDTATSLTLDNLSISNLDSGWSSVAIDLNSVDTLTSTGLRIHTVDSPSLSVGLRSTAAGAISLVDTEMTDLQTYPFQGVYAYAQAISVDGADSFESTDATVLHTGSHTPNLIGVDGVQAVWVSNVVSATLTNTRIDGLATRNPHARDCWGLHLEDVGNAAVSGLAVTNLTNTGSYSKLGFSGLRLTRVASGTFNAIDISDNLCAAGATMGYCRMIWIDDSGNVTMDGITIASTNIYNAPTAAAIAVYNCNSAPGVTIKHAIIRDLTSNSAQLHGLYIASSTGVRVENVTIAGLDDSANPARGVYAHTNVINARITNSIIANIDGWGVHSHDNNNSFDLGYSYSTIHQCTSGADYNALASAGNQYVDPQFVAPGTGNYHLAPGSPCIDSGNPTSPVGDEPLPNGGLVNQGAYGGTGEATTSP